MAYTSTQFKTNCLTIAINILYQLFCFIRGENTQIYTSHKRLVADLGPTHQSMILANHGLLCAGRTIPEAFSNIYYLERACQAQVAALSGGCELMIPSKEVCEHTAKQFEGDGDPARYEFMWESCLRLIENDRPDYRS